MANLYKVSADTSEKEKVIGGIFTAVQGVFLSVGIIMCGVIFLIFQSVMPAVFALIFGASCGGVFIYLFVFKKKEDLDFATYLKLRKNYRSKTKYLLNYPENLKDRNH